jgi:small conductance mechanosensitive channel
VSHPWHRWLVVAGLTVAGTLCAGTLVLRGQPDEAVVRLAGAPVIVVGPTSEETADARAARIERRLERLADRVDEVPQPVVVRQGDGTAVVSVADSPVVTVSRADAEEHVTTVDALATSWAGDIGRALERARRARTSPWGRLAAEARGSLTSAFVRLLESATRVVPRALAALSVLGVFWAIAALVRTCCAASSGGSSTISPSRIC